MKPMMMMMLLAAVALATVPMLATAQPVAYTTTLSGPNENPSNASPGTGNATVFIDSAAHTMRVVVTFSGLTAGTTASHIHCCVASPGTANVATTTPTFAGFPLNVTGGSYDNTLDLRQATSWNPAFITANGGTTAGAEAALLSGIAAGQSYLNVHTSAFPGGEIRGFLVPGTPAVASGSGIPTLGEWGLMLLVLGMATAGMLVLRRRA